MSTARSLSIVVALVLWQPALASAQEVVHPWHALGDGLERIYGWPNVLFHVSAAASTPPLALWVDEPVQESFQRHDLLGGDGLGTAAFVTGWVAPIAVPAALYLGGLAADQPELASAGAATVQAIVVQVVEVSALKWLTDRAGPFPDGDPSARRWSSRWLRDSESATDFDFNPFDLDGGVRWPSGHTAGTVAMVSALVAFYPRELWLALAGYPLALAVGVGMIEGDYHWLSDVTAGALIGHVIGWQVGRAFRERYERGASREPTRTAAAPGSVLLLPAPRGLRLSATF